MRSKISWRVSSSFKLQVGHLLRSWQMGLSWLGAGQTLVVTALKSKISWRVSSSFKQRGLLLLRSWHDGSVVTWGDAKLVVVTALKSKISWKGVQQLQATYSMHLLRSWLMGQSWLGATPDYGGDSSEVQDQLKGVQQVQATGEAFAAILADGSVVTWGQTQNLVVTALKSKINSKVSSRFKQLKYAFAAILADGSVVTWGEPRPRCRQLWSPRSAEGCPPASSYRRWICCDPGYWVSRDLGQKTLWWWQLWSPRSAQRCPEGSSSRPCICCDPGRWVGHNLGPPRLWWWQLQSPRSAQRVSSSFKQLSRAFAAILADGSVVTWGEPESGGDSSEVQDQLKGVQQVQATKRAFAAILADGSVVTWGHPEYGGCSSVIAAQFAYV